MCNESNHNYALSNNSDYVIVNTLLIYHLLVTVNACPVLIIIIFCDFNVYLFYCPCLIKLLKRAQLIITVLDAVDIC